MSRDFDPAYVDGPGEYDPDSMGPMPSYPVEAPQPAIKPVAGAFEWQKERKRPDAIPGPPIRGFGIGGGYTLWLPSAKPATEEAFEGGKFITRIIDPGLTGDADLMALRRRVIDTAEISGPGKLRVRSDFMDYAAGIIRRNYTVTDADLAMLLLESDAWHNEVMEHCLGGAEAVDALAGMPERRPPVSEFDAAKAHGWDFAAPLPAPRRSWWRKLLRK